MTVKTYTADSSIGKRLAKVQQLTLEIDRLKEQLEEEKAFLLGHALRNDYTGLKLGPLSLALVTKANWSYSSTVAQAKARLKHLELAEQESGVAKKTVSTFLRASLSAKVALRNQESLCAE